MKVAKADIILAARELFREKGYAGASMQDLADRVGLRKASLYMRFPNKEALVAEVLNITLDEMFLDCVMERADWDSDYEFIVRSMATTLNHRKRCVGLHLAYGVGDDTPAAKAAVRVFFQSYRDRLTEILSRAIPREIAVVLAADALVRIEGATLLLSLFDDLGAMNRAVDAVLADARAAANANVQTT